MRCYRLKGIMDNMLGIIKKRETEYREVKNYGYSWIHQSKPRRFSRTGKELGYVTVIHPGVAMQYDMKFNMAVLEMYMPVFQFDRGVRYKIQGALQVPGNLPRFQLLGRARCAV